MYFKLFNFLALVNYCSSFYSPSYNKFNKQLSMNLFETGVDLGILTAGTGLILDNTISFNSTQIVKKNKDLYDEGYKKSNINLLFLGPLYFSSVNYLVIHNYHSKVDFYEILPLVIIHNIGYYIMHRSMHKSKYLTKLHSFHHKFKDTVFPSIGNAVTHSEFTFAYMMPFIIGAIIVKPSIENFKIAILLISFFNLIIHCEELKKMQYNEFMVSPNQHIEHHRAKNISKKTYSAPIFNIDVLKLKFERFISILNNFDI